MEKYLEYFQKKYTDNNNNSLFITECIIFIKYTYYF